MEWLKGVVGKVATGLIFLAVGIAALAWWQATPEMRSTILNGTGKSIGWTIAVGVVPWAMFWLVGRVAQMQSNAAGACLIAALTAVEAVTLFWLFHFAPAGGAAWAILIAAILIAGVYNTIACDWIAEQVG